MKKIFLMTLIIGMISLTMLGCDVVNDKKSNQPKEKVLSENIKKEDVFFEELGIKFNLPSKWKNIEKSIDIYGTAPRENVEGQLIISFIPDEVMDKAKKMNEEADKIPETEKAKIEEAAKKIMDLTDEFKEMCVIASIDKGREEGTFQKELFSKYENNDLIGKEGDLDFYFLYNNKPNISNLSEETKKEYEQVYKEVKNLKNAIKIFKPVSEQEKLSKYNKIEFNTKTIDGKKIDSSIFKENKLTMINIWATYCGPCIEEMPDIQKLYEEVEGEKINVIGIISDTPDKDNEEVAKSILSKKGVKFQNIIPDETIKNGILSDIQGVPTTIFVDNEGKVVGEVLVGANNKEDYKKAIEDRLASIK
ncbi:TlpA family protein disulfide reductase [Clostridium ihumii]|uniref:TlpA family protein disulfide reductase n=1 Tax=Clostridium ihumii TaxID=1470356 RepID=UPI00068861C9|nr:TlpA disulfide reductase family protein [Clostridium ihumii]